MFAGFFVVAAVPILAFSVWVQQAALSSEVEAVKEKHLLVAANLTRAISRYLTDVEAGFHMAALHATAEQSSISPQEIEHFLEGLHIHAIKVLAADGKTASEIKTRHVEGPLEHISAENIVDLAPEFKRAGETPGRVIFSNLMRDGSGDPGIFIIMAFAEGGAAIGILDMSYVVSIQESISFGVRGHAAIVDATGRVMAHPIAAWREEMKDISFLEPVKQMMAEKTGVAQFYTPAMQADMIAGYTFVPGVGWGVMVPQPFEELEARAASVQHIATMIALGSLLVVGFLSWWLVWFLSRPIQAVAGAAGEIATGEHSARVPEINRFAPEELQTLRNSFNRMGSEVGIKTAQLSKTITTLEREIAGRKKTEQALGERDEHILAIMETILDAIITMDSRGRILTFNPAAEKIFGYTNAEAVGQNISILVAGDHQARHDNYLSSYAKSGPSTEAVGYTRTLIAQNKNGTAFPIELSVSELVQHGEVIFVGAIRDITERVKTSEALRESRERFRGFAESASDWLWEMDRDLRYTYFSEGFYERFGLSADEMLGKSRRDMMGETTDPEMLAHIENLENHRPFRDFRYEGTMPNGKVMYLSVSGNPTLDNDGNFVGYRGTATDITERRRLGDQLRQAQKMDALGNLAGGVAHEFNNMLVGITGFASMAQDDIDNPEIVAMSLKEISAAADRAAALTQELLTFSRKKVAKLSVINLQDMVMESANFLQTLIGKNVEISFAMERGDARVEIDPGQFSQALTNLVINARDVMPDGGRITVNATNPDVYKIAALKQKQGKGFADINYVCMCVTDNGTGMDASTRAQLFEPFFTTKPQGKGTGLGLSMVYGFMEQSKGFIDVDSTLGKGTTFHLYFPITDKELTVETSDDGKKIKIEGSAHSILVVDDEEVVRKLTENILTEVGAKVFTAKDGKEGLEVWEREGGKISMVLSDIVMPEMSGPEMISRMKEQSPNMKAVFMSGFPGQDDTLPEGLRNNSLFLEKPFTKRALITLVIDALSS